MDNFEKNVKNRQVTWGSNDSFNGFNLPRQEVKEGNVQDCHPGQYWRPGLARLLEGLTLDAEYVRADGDRVWANQGSKIVEVLDLVGGFGANIFGHHHPELVEEEQRILREKIPIFVQGSIRTGAVRLAETLASLVGDFVSIFTNSGAETIEAALKHAYLERDGRTLFWAVKGGFHGKSIGAVQLSWAYRYPYEKLGPAVRYLDPEDPQSWSEAEKEVHQVAAAFIEPIQGEGGIRVLPPDFINWIQHTCKDAGIPLVVDEIQTGMGRTGSFLASHSMGIDPDYLCLSKALGGGLSKIGALMVKRERFVEEFSIHHNSTFAEDDRSALIALKALQIMLRDQLPARCSFMGNELMIKLENLRKRFPDQIKEIRGKGLMVGVELHDLSESPAGLISLLSQQKYLGYLAAAFLLNVYRIRISLTLGHPFTLRLEPSAYVSEKDLDHFLEGLSDFCAALRAGDAAYLTSYQVGNKPQSIVDWRPAHSLVRQKPRSARRVAFVGHLILPEHAVLWDPSLKNIPPSQLESYLEKPSRLLDPSKFEEVNVQSKTGEYVHLTHIGLNLTSRQIMQAIRIKGMNWVGEKIQKAVIMARDLKCQVVGLGGYTSIITGNGRLLNVPGIGITSGNSLTTGAAISAVNQLTNTMRIDLGHSKAAILGASGNIGSTIAEMLASQVTELVLISREPSSPRIGMLLKRIKEKAPNVQVTSTDQLEALKTCQIIVATSNSPDPLIFPSHLGQEPVAICDISLPGDVAKEVEIERPDVTVIKGGVMRLPRNPEFRIRGMALGESSVYACLAEALIMGLENKTGHGSYGPLKVSDVRVYMEMAERHGFSVDISPANYLKV